MKALRLELGPRSYPIFIGAGLIDKHALLAPYLPTAQVMIVSNETVAPLYLARVTAHLTDYDAGSVTLPDGEKYKTLETMNRIITALLERRFDRRCTLIALGGGVVGDIAGFAAACYQRGVNFVQIPTTLLSQVDSSVGGKTGVNHRLGKNMIGAFHQPRCVIADIDTLVTLHPREFRAGLAEVIKYGLIRDGDFFAWLENHLPRLLERDPAALSYVIERSCAIKAEIVAADERESGMRAMLNLGHTFGHAIETGLGYGAWLHGEAVAAGLFMAADLSVRLGWLGEDELKRIESLLRQAGLPVRCPLPINRMLRFMAVDKKALDGALRLVLLEKIGQAVVGGDYDKGCLRHTLAACRAEPLPA